MPKPFKTTVEVKGEKHEVEVTPPEGYLDSEELTAGYVPKENVDSVVSARVRKEVADKVSRARTDFLGDDDFVQEVAKRHGLQKPGQEPKLDEQIKSAQERWEREHLEPLRKQTEELTSANKRLLKSKLVSEVLGAIGGKVEDALLEQNASGVPRVMGLVEGDFAWDQEHGRFAVVRRRNDDGTVEFEQTGKRVSETGSPYMGVQEYLETKFLSDKRFAPFLKSTRQKGAGVGEPGGAEIEGGKLKSSDPLELGRNIEDIASGKVTVESS